MVYNFNITSIEKSDFSLQIEINGTNTFAELNNCIQKACGYKSDQLASFFLAGKNYGKQIEITSLDFGNNILSKCLMWKTHIEDLITSKQQRLLYVFDFFNDRSFYIELTQISMGKNLLEPSVTTINGDAPVQILEEEDQEQGYKVLYEEDKYDYGDLDDYTEIFGEIEYLTEGL